MGSRRQGRIIAFQAIFSYEFNRVSVEELLKFDWIREDKSQLAIDFARLIVAGTLENIIIVDETIKKHLLNWNFNRLIKVDLAVLRISVYCLLFRKEIPNRVTIDEAINISKDFGRDDSYKFVNGVLDSISKKNEAT